MAEQYKEYEPQPEEAMAESKLVREIAEGVRRLVFDEHFDENRAFGEVSRRMRLHFGRTEDQMSDLKKAVENQLLKDSIAKHANRGGKVRDVAEPSVAPIITTPRVIRPVVARPRPSTPPVFRRDDGPDSRERQLPPSDR